jgi:hypothetical protein
MPVATAGGRRTDDDAVIPLRSNDLSDSQRTPEALLVDDLALADRAELVAGPVGQRTPAARTSIRPSGNSDMSMCFPLYWR